jgi:hypothetical protein
MCRWCEPACNCTGYHHSKCPNYPDVKGVDYWHEPTDLTSAAANGVFDQVNCVNGKLLGDIAKELDSRMQAMEDQMAEAIASFNPYESKLEPTDKWEFVQISQSSEAGTYMNKYGQEGWDVAGVSKYYIIMKRRLVDS